MALEDFSLISHETIRVPTRTTKCSETHSVFSNYRTIAKAVLTVLPLLGVLNVFGILDHFAELSYNESFAYPLNVDIRRQIWRMRARRQPDVQPVNKLNVRWLNKELDMEDRSPYDNVEFLVLLRSRANDFQLRNFIRSAVNRTRGSLKDFKMKFYFLLGSPLTSRVGDDIQYQRSFNVQQRLYYESAKHQDLLQTGFDEADCFRQTIAGLEWATNFKHINKKSPSIETFNYLLYLNDEITDDTLRWLPQLLTALANNSDVLRTSMTAANNGSGEIFWGRTPAAKRPERNRLSARYLPLDEYPFSHFPPYLSTKAFLLSRQSTEAMYTASQFVKRFRFCGVYLGIIAKKLEMKPYESSLFTDL